jgi:hypothetical protein
MLKQLSLSQLSNIRTVNIFEEIVDFKNALALTLLVALVFGANYHYFTVSFDNFALVAHGLY